MSDPRPVQWFLVGLPGGPRKCDPPKHVGWKTPDWMLEQRRKLVEQDRNPVHAAQPHGGSW